MHLKKGSLKLNLYVWKHKELQKSNKLVLLFAYMLLLLNSVLLLYVKLFPCSLLPHKIGRYSEKVLNKHTVCKLLRNPRTKYIESGMSDKIRKLHCARLH